MTKAQALEVASGMVNLPVRAQEEGRLKYLEIHPPEPTQYVAGFWGSTWDEVVSNLRAVLDSKIEKRGR